MVMPSKQIKIKEGVVSKLKRIEGDSYTQKIQNLMNIQTASPVDYAKIKSLITEVLKENKVI